MNPYQRIVKDGVEIQRGHIDTHSKFAQLTAGVDLRGKRVLDVGCNLGMMCRLAEAAGAAYVLGIDENPEYISEARSLFPDGRFEVRRAQDATGEFDIAIASSVFHYIVDTGAFFNRMARVSKLLLMDVWLKGDSGPAQLILSKRGLFIPNLAAFSYMAHKHYRCVHERGMALSPDSSSRVVFHLSEPQPSAAEAILIYGKGGSGKSTMARSMPGYSVLELDSIFVDWRVNHMRSFMSVMEFVDQIMNHALEQEYLGYHANYLRKWLGARVNADVVIEGYDMTYEAYREMVRCLVRSLGWKKIREISL